MILILMCGVLSATPAHSGAPIHVQATASQTQLRGLDAAEAASLITRIKEAQAAVRDEKPVYFQLLSGAPAAYPMTRTAPRDAFLAADFDRPFSIERPPIDNRLWKRHRLTLTPEGVGKALWDVEVVLGVNDQIERIEMLYRAPNPA